MMMIDDLSKQASRS